jgi:hypothetical protein
MTEVATIPSPPEYPERIVTFIDLLGFARDVHMIEEHPGLLLSIDAVLSAIVRCKRDLEAQRDRGNLRWDARLTQISDALVLSYRIEKGAFSKAISHAAFLGNLCVRRGYLPRGIITTGKLAMMLTDCTGAPWSTRTTPKKRTSLTHELQSTRQ